VSIEQEIEVKFFPINIDETRTKLEAAGAVLKNPMRLMRRKVYGGEANPGMDCTYGRVRDEGDVITMSAKYSAKGNSIMSQKEAQIVINDFESGTQVLECFGLVPTDYQENRRETWRLADGTLVELEEWPDLPAYLEIEGPSVEALQTVADRLGLNWEEHLTVPTNDLYMSHHGLTKDETHKKLADLRF
jgi:adenylate cyclase, class 2